MSEQSNSFQGAKLRLARIFHGLTLADLDQHISVSRQYLQRLEADPSITPTNELVDTFADALDVKPAFFFEPLQNEIVEDICRFRKRKTTPKHIRNRAVAYGTTFNMILSYLNEECELPETDNMILPHPNEKSDISIKDREDIERISEKCRVQWGLHRDAPIHNMIRTLETVGIITAVFEGISDKIDAFSYLSLRPVIVRNTEKESRSRARFDFAHELGHLVLHQGIEEDDPYLEDQANQFAGAFLLPRGAFFREFPKSIYIDWNELIRMKIRWGVALQALIRRAYDLRMING